MPSPLAHAVSGYAIAKGLEPVKVYRVWRLALYAVFVAIAADFDFLPQITLGIKTHRGFTHSLGFAIVFSLVMGALATGKTTFRAFNYLRLCLLTLLLYGSHLVLDFFTQGGSGIPIFWPMSHERFHSAISLFPAVHHSHGLFDSIHLLFISFELAYTVILLWGLSQWKGYKQYRKKSTVRLE